MLNIFIVILVLVLSVVSGEIYDICLSSQWEGVKTILTGRTIHGIPTFTQTTGNLSFDANHTNIAYFTSGLSNGKAFQRDYLFVYANKLVYIVEDGKCHAEKLDDGFAPLCLPNYFNSTMWTTWFGTALVNEQIYIYGYEGRKNDLTYSIQMEDSFHIDAFQQIRGNLYNEPFMQTTSLANTTHGIKDPDVFNVPTICDKANITIYDVCVSPQWEGVKTILTGTTINGIPTFIQTTGNLSFDANHTSIAYFTSGMSNGEAFNRDYLFVYAKKLVYIVEDGKCHAEKLVEGFAPLCLPNDFNWTQWRTWFGFEKVDDELLIFGYEGRKDDLTYSVQMHAEYHLDVDTFQQIRGSLYNEPFMQTTSLANTTHGIKDPDVFNVPTICDNANITGYFTTPASIYGLFLP